ncbi:hypothetical protein ACFSTE_02605 [Aquimarina hainanensis]|uniref:Uncharacterized protein n=1 Tax=Aquimarina hainanensis TaxID=1578017 RepID=A0ABW5N671_9FLAO
MRRESVIRKKRPSVKSSPEEEINQEIIIYSKELLKSPIVKSVAIVAALYGVLFISKYIIREYAQVVAATKKLRDAHRL